MRKLMKKILVYGTSYPLMVLAVAVIVSALLIIPADAQAKKSDRFITLLSEHLSKECRGNDISINRGYFDEEGELVIESKRVFPGEEFPASFFEQILEELDSHEYVIYDNDPETPLPSGLLGYHIMNCGPHFLDINGKSWHWRGQEVVVAGEQETFATPTATPSPDGEKPSAISYGFIAVLVIFLAVVIVLLVRGRPTLIKNRKGRRKARRI